MYTILKSRKGVLIMYELSCLAKVLIAAISLVIVLAISADIYQVFSSYKDHTISSYGEIEEVLYGK